MLYFIVLCLNYGQIKDSGKAGLQKICNMWCKVCQKFRKVHILFKIRKYPPVPYCQAFVIVSIGFVVLIPLLVGARGTSSMFPK